MSANPPHWNEVIFDNPHGVTTSILSYAGIESSSIPHIEITSICTTHKKQVNFHAHSKTRDFHPAFVNQVNVDRPHKKINLILTLKLGQSWPLH